MTDDFFRSRLEQMIEHSHPLAVLAQRLPWEKIEARLAPQFAHQARPLQQIEEAPDLLGAVVSFSGAKVSNAGRPRLSMRLMVAMSLLKNSFDLSDEELVQRFAENVYWQYFAGYDYFDPRPPCDATQIGRFRTALGEAGLEELLSATLHTAVDIGAVKKSEFERLLDIGRRKVVAAAKRCGLLLKQTFAAEGRALRRQAGGYAHARQFKRLQRVVKRQRTILGIVIREVRRRLQATAAAGNTCALASMHMWLDRAERIRSQQRQDKNKLYALHAPEVECIAKGKARKPYEFGVKVSVAVTHKQGLVVGARSFPGNPYDGHIFVCADGAKRHPCAGPQRQAQTGGRGLGISGQRGGPGQSRSRDHPSGENQNSDQGAAALAQTQVGSGAGHRAPQVRQPDAALLACRCDGRCAARAVLRRGLQPALADEGRGASGPEGSFVVPVLAGLWRAPCR
jgi:transposase, IS5 family